MSVSECFFSCLHWCAALPRLVRSPHAAQCPICSVARLSVLLTRSRIVSKCENVESQRHADFNPAQRATACHYGALPHACRRPSALACLDKPLMHQLQRKPHHGLLRRRCRSQSACGAHEITSMCFCVDCMLAVARLTYQLTLFQDRK